MLCSLWSHLNVLTFPPLTMLRRCTVDAFRFFFKQHCLYHPRIPVRACEFVFAIHDMPSRPASASWLSSLKRNVMFAHRVPSAFRDGVQFYTGNRHRVSLEFTRGYPYAYRWPSLPRRSRWDREDNSSSVALVPVTFSVNRCCLFRYQHAPIFLCLTFPTPCASSCSISFSHKSW